MVYSVNADSWYDFYTFHFSSPHLWYVVIFVHVTCVYGSIDFCCVFFYSVDTGTVMPSTQERRLQVTTTKTFSEYCPDIKDVCSVSITYIKYAPLGGNTFWVKDKYNCQNFDECNLCGQSECPIYSAAPETL